MPLDKKFLAGPSSGLQDVVTPNHPGAGAEPVVTLQEVYRFRAVGEHFTDAPGHVRMVHENGKWYEAKWVEYEFEAEKLTYIKMQEDLGGLQTPPSGNNVWAPVDMKEIYRVANNNPRLTLYLPDNCGNLTLIGADAPPRNPGVPIMSAPR